jgi:hypothetical protein
MPQAFEAEVSLNSIKIFSPYLKENTAHHHYKDQPINAKEIIAVYCKNRMKDIYIPCGQNS